MKYISTCGSQMVDAEQFLNRESMNKIIDMDLKVIPALKGIFVDDKFVLPGQYVVKTFTAAVIIKDSDIFNERFKPIQIQDELF